jgi:hypothetical protein
MTSELVAPATGSNVYIIGVKEVLPRSRQDNILIIMDSDAL